MFKSTPAFSGFSVDNLAAAKKFYVELLGLELEDDKMGLNLKLYGGGHIFIYPKENHQPATYTMLNFVVDDIDKTVSELKAKGITLEQYDMGGGAKTDKVGIMRGISAKQGPDIAWFKDPAGNIISVLQEK
jgi:catechol 2,3-dioxygenase-like lactoylglutathione lyase family enzyme